MKNIQPIQIWQNGHLKTATHISLTLVHDNLQDVAVFSYRLCRYVGQDDEVLIDEIVTGAVTIEGQEYQDWGTTMSANDEAYIINCEKLNLILDNEK